jgi:hypothetical protein
MKVLPLASNSTPHTDARASVVLTQSSPAARAGGRGRLAAMRIAYLAELVLVLVPGTVIAMIDGLANWGHIPFMVVVVSLGWNVFAPAIRWLLTPARSISDQEWTKISRYAAFGLVAVVLWIVALIKFYSSRWNWELGTWIQVVVIVYGYVLPALVGVHWFIALRRQRAAIDPKFARSLQPATLRCVNCNSSVGFETITCPVCGYVFGR